MAHGFTFDASYAGIRIDVLSSNIAHGRKTKPHTFPKRDGATVEDMGRGPWVCGLQFIFIDRKAQPGELQSPGTAIERFNAFDKLVDEGTIRRLVHPYTKSRLCSISDFTHDADGDGGIEISCSATFTEENSIPPTFAAGGGVQTIAGSHEVESKVLQANASLELPAAGLSLAELEDAQLELDRVTLAVEQWDSDPSLSARQVHLQMATINNALSSRLEDLDTARDINRFPIMKQYTLLQYQVRLAAEAFTTDTTRVVTITTVEPLPLRVIAARFYGANQAERRFAEMLELNPEIRNPGLIGRGIDLKAYSANAEPGAF